MVQQQRFQVRVAVVFSSAVMLVVRPRRGKLFQPLADVFNEPALMVVDVNSRSDVHGRDKAQAVSDSAARDNLLHFVGDVHHLAPLARFKNQIFSVTFHEMLLHLRDAANNETTASRESYLPSINFEHQNETAEKQAALPQVTSQQQPKAEGGKKL